MSHYVKYIMMTSETINTDYLHSIFLQEYSNIVILDLSYNTIDTVALKAFESMKHLQKLDLSYNRIEQIDSRLFESNSQLTHLDLSGNKFMSLSDHALIKSSSLEELTIVDCKLVHIPHLMFHAVPSLRNLDLSQNLLKVIHIKSFQKMKRLAVVNLEDNFWNCDDEMFKVLKWFKKRDVMVKRNQCCKCNGYFLIGKKQGNDLVKFSGFQFNFQS